VNQPVTQRELHRIQTSLQRSRPFGSDTWIAKIASNLHLDHTLRSEGRPKSKKEKRHDEKEQN